MDREQANSQLTELPGWELSEDGMRIRREWMKRDFVDALEFFEAVANIAESEGHHPDLHLTEYRRASIVLWTHAIGGLSANDFILAAKIDAIADLVD